MSKKKMGRPKKEIDISIVDKLCEIQCTGEEIAGVIGVDYDTLNTRIKEETGLTFSEYFQQKASNGKSSLRRMQWKAAESGNPTLLIWLGKQYLGQKDKQEMEHSGDIGVTVKWG